MQQRSNLSNAENIPSKPSQTGSVPCDRLQGLRITVCCALLATAAAIGFCSYHFLHESQHDLQEAQYDALARKIAASTQNSLVRKQEALQTMAVTVFFLFPNISSWPYTAIPFAYWDPLSMPLIGVAKARSISLSPIITPDEVPAFEAFAYRLFNASGHPELGISPFGRGIYAVNASTGQRYHDLGAFGAAHGQHRILTPVLQIGNLSSNARVIMYNAYSEQHRIDAIDKSISCAQAIALSPTPSTSSPSPSSYIAGQDMKNCTAITDIVFLVQDTGELFHPASLMTYPIQSADGQVVAIASIGFVWEIMLRNAINDHVCGIDLILSFGGNDYSFSTDKGMVIFAGPGDLHDRRYDSRRFTFLTSPHGGQAINVHIYPTDEWVETYENSLPGIICGVTVGIMVLTSFVFFFYDYLMNRAAHEHELVLSTKRQFVRYISHEIRTPLNIVQMGFRLLHAEITAFQRDGGLLDDSLTDWLGLVTDIADSADVAITVLNDLINYDKLSMGTLQLEIEALLIWDLITPSVHPFLIQARQAGTNLTTILQAEQQAEGSRSMMRRQIVFGDSCKLGQVIRNLVSNALKFVPSQGEVCIEAHWNPIGMPGVSVPCAGSGYERCGSFVLTVTDNGAGMTAENVRGLFQEGVQFQANQLQAGQGSGLGLWIAKGIVSMHHGTLTATSPGVQLGSTFTLELPLFKSLRAWSSSSESKSSLDLESLGETDGGGAGRQTSLTAAASSPSSLWRGTLRQSAKIRNILVTDDSALNRKMLCRLLRTAGYVCFEAHDGQDCVDKVMQAIKEQGEHDPIDVILMDYEMPRMDGPTATEVLRSMGCHLPIVGITGNVLNEDKEYFLDKGAVKVLTKPISLPQLKEVLTELQTLLPAPDAAHQQQKEETKETPPDL